ncbi:hypothetical protein EMIHUDRAFT_255229 [Emiliania huxleyi CCMP1516]|uniref:Uncharacterized protein n=2 Tax=Emiliania huxleyi TaxID=2903 RepID=A0A0D3JDG4_EMIH1|nr:hypothetical protein EMIHUDRAFT_255229 [Emiliania huxleyi CCMP1516]EOD21549.1 hypothetical protein EMIHUDRAFT_255229 [Emiliania huxleyi CCMP1516]|eukprot:XP_005773978.1 hypothetical protein EMIHUDRAFT_255229 [Emiliania huxleyi CCMP1516]
MESEPPESETCDDEGDDERDKSASADDEMAFIDDAFFELPDVATEEEAEGGGSQSQYSQQSLEAESEGSQNSQGSRNTARSDEDVTTAARHNTGGDDGTGSDDEEMPDRKTEPGPSERLSEEGPPE